MYEWLNHALGPFKSGRAQARLLVNDVPTKVFLTWGRSSMTVSNLEDLPFVRLRSDGHLEISKDAVEWRETDDEIASGLQLYRILDPVTVLPKTEFTGATGEDIFTIKEGNYLVNRLDLPHDIVDFFDKHNNGRRWVRISQLDGELIEMTQRDFPPFSDTISLVFGPYFLHRRFWNLP